MEDIFDAFEDGGTFEDDAPKAPPIYSSHRDDMDVVVSLTEAAIRVGTNKEKASYKQKYLLLVGTVKEVLRPSHGYQRGYGPGVPLNVGDEFSIYVSLSTNVGASDAKKNLNEAAALAAAFTGKRRTDFMKGGNPGMRGIPACFEDDGAAIIGKLDLRVFMEEGNKKGDTQYYNVRYEARPVAAAKKGKTKAA